VNEHGEVIGVLSNDRPGADALDLAVPVEGLKALLGSDTAPEPLTALVRRAGASCTTYGVDQCASNCWDAYDGASCATLARIARQKREISLAFDAASRACRLAAPGGCADASSLLLEPYEANRPALSEMTDILFQACSNGQSDACGMVPTIAHHAGRPLDAAATVGFLDKGCAGGVKRACVELAADYAKGNGVKRSLKRAAEYRSRARRAAF
jgi:hypothetical protein